ncbi:hypothetical protein [Pseudoalteromonas mariniglutinosa]|uniref:hypothetical protein n=1 Tax=Pseudoalteromonas mariniglutinosa TaxID=206042 RepID=UPI00384D0389
MSQKAPFIALAMVILTTASTSFATEPWQPGSPYPQGSEICYKDILYKARWWATPGEQPGHSHWGAWVANVTSKSCSAAIISSPHHEQANNQLKSLPTIFDITKEKGSSD